jgi:hypothetical protein
MPLRRAALVGLSAGCGGFEPESGPGAGGAGAGAEACEGAWGALLF